MKAIPAIDLIDGNIVRLYQGNFEQQTTYESDPLTYAKNLFESGAERLHLVDLSGAKSGKLVHTEVLRTIASQTSLRIDFGGGVTTADDVETILNAGAAQVVIGSLCVREPGLVDGWIQKWGTKRVILALDTDGENVRINGWQTDSGKTLDDVIAPFTAFEELEILTTDIRRDGTGKGPSVDLYRMLVQRFPQFRWIASGGVEKLEDLYDLRASGCTACVVGKALLEGKITISELTQFNNERSL